jgi:hypothetical protein
MDFLNIWDLNFMPNFIFLFTMKENHPFTVKYDLHDLNKLILFVSALLPTSYEVIIKAFTYDRHKSFIFL